MDRTSGCVCRYRGSCLVPVRVRRWRMMKQAYEYRPRPSTKSRGINSLEWECVPAKFESDVHAPPRRGGINAPRWKAFFLSLSPFQNMHTAEKRRMEWWCFPRDCIDRSRVDFSDNCGHGGLRRLWWLSFCTFRCFGVNRKRGRRGREGGRGNRITRAVGEKDEKVGKTCCVYRIYIPFFFLSFDVTMCFFLNIIKGRERVLIKLQVINYRCEVSRFICSNFYRGTKVFLFFAGNREFWFVHESNELNFILYVILFSKVLKLLKNSQRPEITKISLAYI